MTDDQNVMCLHLIFVSVVERRISFLDRFGGNGKSKIIELLIILWEIIVKL